MPGKMEEKTIEILEQFDHLQSEGCELIVQAICELARYIDEVEKQKEDDEFIPESDKKADLPSLGPILSKKPYPLPPRSPVDETEEQPPKEVCKECGIAIVQHPEFPGNPKS